MILTFVPTENVRVRTFEVLQVWSSIAPLVALVYWFDTCANAFCGTASSTKSAASRRQIGWKQAGSEAMHAA